MRSLTMLLLMVAAPALAADIWVGTDASGVITFTDTPPSGDGFDVFIKDLDKDRPGSWAAIDAAMLRRNLDRWDREIVDAAAESDLAPELLKALVLVESGMNPQAKSPKGAQGLTQLMPGTAQDLGVADPWDPGTNLRGGARYLRRMIDEFGEKRLALAAYNAGPGNVRKHGGVPPFQETRYYVDKVLQYYAYFLRERPLRRG